MELDHCLDFRSDMWKPKPFQIVAGVSTLILMMVSGGRIEAAGKKKKKKNPLSS